MASVRQLKKPDKSGKRPWVCEYTDAGGVRRRDTPKSGLKKDAEAIRRRIEREMDDGSHVAANESVTVADGVRLWLEDCERQHKAIGSPARSTIILYEGLTRNHIVPVFGRVMVADLTGDAVKDFLIAASGTHSFGTVRHLRMVLVKVLKFCVRKRYLRRNVIKDEEVRTPGESTRVVMPSREQLETLLAALVERARGEQVLTFLQRRVLVFLALFGGMRIGEICGLMWDRWDARTATIHIVHSFSAINGLKCPKTKAGSRDIGLPAVANQALFDLWEHLGRPDRGFILETKTGKNMKIGYDQILWRPLLHKAGLTFPKRRKQRFGRPRFHFHALRHASVSLLIAAGVPAIQIAPFVGHKSVTTTLGIYGHLFPEDDTVRSAVANIGAAMVPALPAPKPLSR